MNSLPFLSHHLFAAAVGHDDPLRRKPLRRDLPPAMPDGHISSAPREMADAIEPARDHTTHPHRGLATPGT